ncbi:MAG: class I SAM-dependent methyltransferase [Actinomycetia bacterium]|nr:class I SAM-dependent methyltransferase [Actinomycetes bacterium]
MSAEKKRNFPKWEQFYQEADMEKLPWFFRDLEPDVRTALKELDLHKGRALDLGTGPGTQAMGLAAIGFDVTATDISQAAVDHARNTAEAAGLEIDWRVDDILHTSLTDKFDLIFDRGCFHVLNAKSRPHYVADVSGLLNPGGYLLLKTFIAKEPEPEGPHRFAPEDIKKYFSPALEIISIRETVFQGTLDPLPRALFAIMRQPAKS